jgi:hypothetical protein
MNARIAKQANGFDMTSFVMDYEGGELDDEATIAGFQHLIDNGMAWQLQGHYGRTAHALIEAGYCTPAHQ